MRRILSGAARVLPIAAIGTACLASTGASKERSLPVLPVLPFAAAVRCDADDADYYDVDAEHGEEAGASSGAGVALEEFDDVEHGKSFSVNEMSGLTVMLMGTLVKGKGGGRERASAGTQVMIDKGYHTVYMFSDDRDPSISAVYTPGPEGHVLRLSSSKKLGRATTVEGETVFSPGQVMSKKVSAKYIGSDFSTQLTAKDGQQGASLEYTYHQAVTPSGSLTMGGTVTALVDRLLPYPVVKPKGDAPSVMPAVFGTYTRTVGDAAAVAPGNEVWMARASVADASGSLRYWRQTTKELELGAHVSGSLATGHSVAGVGMKMSLGGQGLPPGFGSTLTATANSDMKVAMQYQTMMMNAMNGEQALFILAGAFDHKQQHHSVGAMVQFHF